MYPRLVRCDGHRSVLKANVSAGLSPVVHTKKLFTLRDLQAKKRKAMAMTKKAKLHRIQLKSKRQHSASSCEVREGVENHTDYNYHSFVLPSCQVTPKAAEITGITFENGQLLFKGNVMPAVGIKKYLNDFISFLDKSHNNVIIGHNICNYDCMVLYTALEKCSLLDKFMTSVSGFVDTLLLFKSSHPDLSSYSQPYLFQTLLGQTYDAHRADEDVDALYTLVNKLLLIIVILK
ncbi:unnamed protein product [Mytilus edulis]|uniref:Exonuclease domain-containing protein n=1 Tax=Mytilus edulis TaxID=6550 RepID=A0A8S3SAU7_MYTED|nr:unnamed protein product [Mytilus edulis]